MLLMVQKKNQLPVLQKGHYIRSIALCKKDGLVPIKKPVKILTGFNLKLL